MSIKFSEVTLIAADMEDTVFLTSGHPSKPADIKNTREYIRFCCENVIEGDVLVRVNHFCFGCEGPEIDADGEHFMLIDAYNDFAGEYSDSFTSRDDVEHLDYIEFAMERGRQA